MAATKLTESELESLRSYIGSERRKELECRPFLIFAAQLLFNKTVVDISYSEFERRTAYGDFDIALSARIKSDQNIEETVTYLWELKAPQCYIFEKDTENRLKPSEDLFSAENQLLHYYHECKHNADFLHTHNLSHPNFIYAGGIIIGRDSTKVKGDMEKTKADTLFRKTNLIRQTYFYNNTGMRIITWDRILEFIQSNYHIGKEIVGSLEHINL